MNTAELLTRAWSLMAYGTVAVLVVLLVGVPLRRWFGGGHAYASWALLPVTLAASVIPHTHPTVSPTLVGLGVMAAHAAVPPASPIAAPAYHALIAWIWFAGFLATIGVAAVRHVRCKRLLIDARPKDPFEGLTVVTSARWPYGPATVGLVKPLIVLPADFDTRYDDAERMLVLRHEATHVRRHDTLWNALATLIVAVGWFNPLAYIAWHRFRRDQELAVDDAVVRYTGARRTYAEAMFKSVRPVPSLSAVCGWLGHHSLQERIMMLNKPSRSPFRRRFATATLLVSTATASVALYAADLPTDATEATVRITVNQSGRPVTENMACAVPGQRISIPYDHGQKDFGELQFRMSRTADGTQWEVHDLVKRNDADLYISSYGFYGNEDDPSSTTYVVPDNAAVHAVWGNTSPEPLAVDIRMSPGCDTIPVAAR